MSFTSDFDHRKSEVIGDQFSLSTSTGIISKISGTNFMPSGGVGQKLNANMQAGALNTAKTTNQANLTEAQQCKAALDDTAKQIRAVIADQLNDAATRVDGISPDQAAGASGQIMAIQGSNAGMVAGMAVDAATGGVGTYALAGKSTVTGAEVLSDREKRLSPQEQEAIIAEAHRTHCTQAVQHEEFLASSSAPAPITAPGLNFDGLSLAQYEEAMNVNPDMQPEGVALNAMIGSYKEAADDNDATAENYGNKWDEGKIDVAARTGALVKGYDSQGLELCAQSWASIQCCITKGLERGPANEKIAASIEDNAPAYTPVLPGTAPTPTV